MDLPCIALFHLLERYFAVEKTFCLQLATNRWSNEAAAEGDQGKAKKKAVKPLANRSRYDLYARCFSRADCAI